MLSVGPPVQDFDSFKPVTMTVLVSYEVEEINLPGIFTFLPVTKQNLSPNSNIQKKQGKIRLPSDLNQPGEIISMRFDGKVRGIIRSNKIKSFSHSIIIDMGTTTRIISSKLSRNTLEFTGPPSLEIAKEAAANLINLLKKVQSDLEFIRENREQALEVKDLFLKSQALLNSESSDIPLNIHLDATKSLNRTEQNIWNIFQKYALGYPKDRVEDFLTFMINFNRNLYTGSLKLGNFECVMVNILFNLGYSIDQLAFSKVMNSPPFRCGFNNYKSASAVIVYYDYVKHDKNGQVKLAQHTIRTNRSGHVRHSGPNLEAMKGVYYAFIQKTIQNYHLIKSVEPQIKYLKITGPSRSFSLKEWEQMVEAERTLREKILRGEVPIAKGVLPKNLEKTQKTTGKATKKSADKMSTGKTTTSKLPIIENSLVLEQNYPNQVELQVRNWENKEQSPILKTFNFDYTPLLASF